MESKMQDPKLGSPCESYEEDDEGGVFLDEADMIDEVPVDEEDLPEADDTDGGDDVEDDSMHTFTGHADELYAVACSPTDPKLVATGGGDNKGFLWKIGLGDWVSELKGHEDSVACLAFSSDGQLLASGGLDGLVQIWDASSGNLKFELEGPDEDIEWVRWHPKTHVVLAGSENKQVWMWDADEGSFLSVFEGHKKGVSCGDFTPDGKFFCTGSYDGSLRIWEPNSGRSKVVKGDDTNELRCLALSSYASSDSTIAITGSELGSVNCVNIPTCRVVSSLVSHSDSVECVGISPSSCLAATGSLDKKLVVWDLVHSMPRVTCEHEGGVRCLAWLGESKYLATGCEDGKVRLWDSLSGDCVRIFSGHSHTIQSLAISADLHYLVSGSSDETARVFEIA